MNYRQSIAYLNSLGNELHGMEFGLGSIRAVMDAMGNPHQRFPSVLIAGTNGKGSVAHLLDAILQSAGIRGGLYTSPQVVDLEERFSLAGTRISPDELAASMSAVAEAVRGGAGPLTHFETLTALAFDYFARRQAQIAVLEVGLGGRLDATNIADPLLSIITPIGYDHQRWLGDTLAEIAGEKAGILRRGRPLLNAPQEPEAADVLQRRAAELDSPLVQVEQSDFQQVSHREGFYAFRYRGMDLRPGLRGAHQMENAALAAQAALHLADRGFPIGKDHIEKGIAAVRLKGRIQKIGERPDIFVDGAHNPQAARSLADFIVRHTSEPRALLFSMLADKDIQSVADIFRPLFSHTLLTPLPSPRAAALETLRDAFPGARPFHDLRQALHSVSQQASTIVIAGSFTLAGLALSRSTRSRRG
ncbi:MAG TPA: folylpolyglutamate synthase/dihydrofolate synthase family protein [Acidobacteriota bacterium]|nr:folylpolyglutamate synthase/dihydrofolate synthase family protein [Acidobacteriota bacterium]